MRRDRAMRLLEAVARGEVPPGDALDALALPPTEAVADFAQLDHHRALRQGVPEVVFGAGKTAAQCVAIAERFAALGDGFLVTRAEPVARDALLARFPGAVASELGRTVRLAATDAAP